MSDNDTGGARQPFCGIEECEEIARYVETGDGHAIRNARLRCHGHKPSGGLWRDMRVAVRPSYERYLDTGT